VTIDYAPYFPTWVWGASGYAFNGLVDLENKSGLKEVTIAFVLSNGGCNTTQDIEQNIDDVKAFIAAGGHVKASFGGASGTYVEAKCGTAAELATAIEDFVDATGITDLDFDIEQDPVLTDAVNARRAAALKLAQDAKGIQVAFTLAANPHTSSSQGGMTAQGLSVVSHALSAGVKVRHVNLMTMDYGDSYGGQPLAPVAIGSLNDANAQLMSIAPGLTQAQAWGMLGVIPMIGKNDDAEIFSLDDAKTVADFAKANGLGRVSFWSIDRDQVCSGGADFNTCSTVQSANFAFHDVLKTAAE
jgi:chitinase